MSETFLHKSGAVQSVDWMVNNIGDQLGATIILLISRDQLNMFRAIFAHLQERKTVIYGMWYSVLQRWIYSSHVLLKWYIIHINVS
jgi:hypothetical protein